MAVRRDERPTLPPGFDVRRFARESDLRLRTVGALAEAERYDLTEGIIAESNERLRRAEAVDEGIDVEVPIDVELPVDTDPFFDATLLLPHAANEPSPAIAELVGPETRIATRPCFGVVVTHEAWAREMRGAPVVALDRDALKRLPLDHRAGFVLSMIDGATDLETLVALCAMDRSEVLVIARDLYESGVIRFP